MAVEVTGQTKELLERRRLRQNAEVAGAKSTREARGKKADGGVHNVRRGIAKSRTQEAAAAHHVAMPPVKRWQRAHALPYLQDPPGYVLCYIARHNQHRGDEAGLIAALQEGWEFARKEDFPGRYLPTQVLADHGQIIGNASSVLMKLPEELKAQRDAYYNGRRDRATRQVNNPKPGLREANSKMPLVEDVNESEHRVVRERARRTPTRVEGAD